MTAGEQVKDSAKKKSPPIFLSIIFILAACALWPYRFVASPESSIHVVDEIGRSMTGIRIVRQWNASGDQRGEEEASTDAAGTAYFRKKMASVSLLKRVTAPLLKYLPAICAPGEEIYGYSEFHIYRPAGYELRFNENLWQKIDEVYQNTNGVCIRDPALAQKYHHENEIQFYISTMKDSFDYTLKLYRTQK